METWEQMRAAGGPTAWFDQQLDSDSVPEDPKVGYLDGWFPELFEPPAVKFTHSKVGYSYAEKLSSWTMLRRIHSHRQVHETMVDFWSNHLHVSAVGGTAWVQRFHYDQTVRQHALGRFEDLLVACTLHPAMLIYLDNFRSVKDAPNENHGRELLELHTVGRASGYTEQMVKDSAVILSGYRVDFRGTWEQRYNPRQHTTGPVQVLGFSHPNADPDGSRMTVDYLRYLAHHPATARTIATKLVIRFVGDYPPAALVDRLAQVYLDSGTDIRPVLRALVASAEFQQSAGQKVRPPVDDLVATCRALRVRALRPTGGSSFAHRIANLHRGLPLFQWPRPGRCARAQRRLGVGRPDAQLLPDALGPRLRGAPVPRRALPQAAAVAAAAQPPPRPLRRPPVAHAAGPTVDTRPSSRRSARPPATSPTRSSTGTTSWRAASSSGSPPCSSTRPRT